MSDTVKTNPIPRPGEEAGAALLATGGLAAAFGAAACCVLPALLGAFGLGSASLFGLALLAGLHQTLLLATGAACLVGSVLLLWRHRTTAVVCTPGAACPSSPVFRRLTGAGLTLGPILLVLSYAYV